MILDTPSQVLTGGSSRSLSVRRASVVFVSTAQPVGFEGGAHTGDEPGTTLEAEIGPEPLRHVDQPVAQADQEVDVGDAPDPPRKPSLELQAPERDDGGFTPHECICPKPGHKSPKPSGLTHSSTAWDRTP